MKLKRHWFMIPCNRKASHGIMTSEISEVTCDKCKLIMKKRKIKKSITKDIMSKAVPV